MSRYLIYTLGVALWLFYGIVIRNGPMIVLNTAILLMAFSMIYLKIKYG